MERRKILLGSGAALATVLAGCASSETDNQKTKDDTKTNKENDHKKDNKEEKDDKENNQKKKGEKADIPGFDRDAFDIDSDVIHVKKVTCRKGKFDLRVMVTTTDRDVLVEEFRALAPSLTRAIRNADEFLTEVKEIKITVIDKHKNRVLAVFLDVQWLRKLLNGDITNDEFVKRILDLMESVNGGPPLNAGQS